jgi:D-alanine-D-alanine ligase
MRIGITCDLKTDAPPAPPGCPDDYYEEYDEPATVEAIAAVLRELGHDVEVLGDGRKLVERLLASPPNLVFNLAEGQGVGRSREARVPALLEMLGIPHTGSDPLTLAVTLDKDCAKRLVASAGVGVPRGFVVSSRDDLPPAGALPGPVIVKPAWEGSSKGIRGACVLAEPSGLAAAVKRLQGEHRQPVLVEEFIAGDEITVGLVGNASPQMVGVMRVVPLLLDDPQRFVYGLEAKRDWRRQVRYESPPPYTPERMAAIESAARTAYRVLGCRDVARIDFRVNDTGVYFLEANPLPGLNPETSDLVILGRLAGWTHARLITAIVGAALDRLGLVVSPRRRVSRPRSRRAVAR